MPAVFTAHGMLSVRPARPRRVHLLAILFALTSFAHVPWAILWLRGSGPVAAVGAVTVAIAASTSSFALRRRRTPFLALVLVLATDRDRGCVSLVRRARRRCPIADRDRRCVASGARAPDGCADLPLVLGSALFVSPLVDCERRMLARLRALRVRRWVIAAAFLLAIAVPTSAFAATVGAFAGIAAELSPVSVGGALGSWAVALSAAVGAWGRRHDRTKDRSPAVFAVGVTVIALVTVSLAMELP